MSDVKSQTCKKTPAKLFSFLCDVYGEDFENSRFLCCVFRENPVNLNQGKFQPWPHFPNHVRLHSVIDRKNTVSDPKIKAVF